MKGIREEKGLTQQQIAGLVNMRQSNYSRVEAGDRDLPLGAVNKIAR
nr:helix-turn-helix domain-containing protein [Cytophagales bacterium]